MDILLILFEVFGVIVFLGFCYLLYMNSGYKLQKDVDDAHDDMHKHVTEREKNDPEYAALIKKHYRPVK
jgi:hypothetical protein